MGTVRKNTSKGKKILSKEYDDMLESNAIINKTPSRMKERAMTRPNKHVPTSPSGHPPNEMGLRRNAADQPVFGKLESHILLPSGRILVIGSNTEADLIEGGGKITWSVPLSWRDHLGIDRLEITESDRIVIFPGDKPGEYPHLKLSNWEYKGYCFGRAILDPNGWVKAATEGGVYCYTEGEEGELKVMTEAERLWNIIPVE